jgi:outer membrane protein
MLNKIFIAATGLLFSTSLVAQTKWDLQRCVTYATENNLTLKLSDLTTKSNEATYNQSQYSRLPNLNGSAGQSWNYGFGINPATNQIVNTQVWSNNYGLNSSVTLFNGNSINNTIKQNANNVEVAKMDYERAKNDLILNVLNNYLQIVLNRELVEVAKIQAKNTEEQLDRTLKLIEAGRLAEFNKYDLMSQKANDELRIVTAQNNVSAAEVRLKQLLQLPMEDPFELEIPAINDPDENTILTPAAEVYNTAEATQPLIKVADLQIKSADYGINIAKANLYPTLSLNAGANTRFSSASTLMIRDVTTQIIKTQIGFVGETPTTDPSKLVYSQVPRNIPRVEDGGYLELLNQNLGYFIGLNLQIPIFNRFQVRNSITQATIQRQRTVVQAQQTRNQLRQTIEQSYIDAKAAAKSFAANKVRANALKESTAVAEQRFNLGAINMVEYTLSKNNLAIAQSDMVRTKYEYIFRLKVLDFYMGREVKL